MFLFLLIFILSALSGGCYSLKFIFELIFSVKMSTDECMKWIYYSGFSGA